MATASASAGASGSYLTPTKRAAFVNAEAGPSRARPAGSSPAYSSRRHSLYGIEDRIIIEPGSRCWKVGFSGEVDPRATFDALPLSEGREAWDLDLVRIEAARGDKAEARRLIGVRVLKQLRATYTQHLMTDPKARKVIVVENTYLPSYVKDEIAKSLFENLKVPSVSFTPSSVLALAVAGKITGLVVDCGWLETTITPVYHSRPLFHLSRATPIAGRRLHRRLKALLRHHAKYYPPPLSFSSLARQAVSPVPPDIITDALVQSIIRQGCFVSNPISEPYPDTGTSDDSLSVELDEMDDTALMARLRERYRPGADATDLRLSLPALSSETQGMGPSTLVVPGWVRERAAEVLFEDEDSEAESIPELVLQCISKLPIDLRPTMIASILVVGGTPSLPGFIPRLRASLLHSLRPRFTLPFDDISSLPLHTPQYRQAETKAWRKRHQEPYKELYPLSGKLAILNDPCPLDGSEGGSSGGLAPRWKCGLMNWVGGSLAGALKTGAPEMLREEYDALAQAHIDKGELYQHRLVEESTFLSEVLADSSPDVPVVSEPENTSVPLPAIRREELQGELGVQIEDLLPGMAIGGGVRRKRGWNTDMAVGDWSRVVKA